MTMIMNGRETRPMPSSTPSEPDKTSDGPLYLFSLRLWIFCALVIVGYGLANYALNWWVGLSR